MTFCIQAGSYGPLSRGRDELSGTTLRGLRRGIALIKGDRPVGVVPTVEMADWVVDGPLLLRAALETLSDVLDLHRPDRGGRCPTCDRPVPCPTWERMERRLLRAEPARHPGDSAKLPASKGDSA